MATETVYVRGAHDGCFEQSVVFVDRHERLDDERDEAQILFGCLARSVEQDARVGLQGPVVVLTGAVDAGKGLLMEQTAEAMLARHVAHERHDKHIVVDGQVTLFVDRGEFELVRGDLVVTCLDRDAEFQRLDFQLLHEGCHALRYGAEVVVLHLLVLCRVVPHERAARQKQVGACGIEAFVDEEVFLLPPEVDYDAADVGIEVLRHGGGGFVHGEERFFQGSLVVERFAGV